MRPSTRPLMHYQISYGYQFVVLLFSYRVICLNLSALAIRQGNRNVFPAHIDENVRILSLYALPMRSHHYRIHLAVENRDGRKFLRKFQFRNEPAAIEHIVISSAKTPESSKESYLHVVTFCE